MKKVTIQADIDHTELVENKTYDVAAVRIRAVDESGNILPFFNDVVSLKTQGRIELIGPAAISLHGGMGGTYIKTIGKAGRGKLVIKCAQAEDIAIEVNVRLEEN
jgi:beta-galactosidase